VFSKLLRCVAPECIAGAGTDEQGTIVPGISACGWLTARLITVHVSLV